LANIKDAMELLRPLLNGTVPGLNKLMSSKKRKSTIKVSNNNYELQFGEQDDDTIPMKFYLIGDLKFLFMMLRDAADSWAVIASTVN
jgi:hypothetical protein